MIRLFLFNFIFQSSPNILGDRKPVKEVRKVKPKSKDSPDVERSSTADSPGLLFDSPTMYVGDVTEMISPLELNDDGTTNGGGGGGCVAATANTVEADTECVNVRNEAVADGKNDGPSPCIVCEKVFKSKSCLNKHLRNVHTGMFGEFP